MKISQESIKIELATKHDVKSVFTLLSRCKDYLIEQGIFQWNAEYPNLKYVENDIAKSSLVKLTNGSQLIGIVSFDDFQEPKYRTVNWLIDQKSKL